MITMKMANKHEELAKLARDPSRRAEFLDAVPYMKWYEGIDFRKNPELYKIGKGEQGALMAQPYKSEIVPHWRFSTPEVAMKSAKKIEEMFHAYLEAGDFPGADMARKCLMMGWTRARRYANHPSGRKYKKGTREVLPLAEDHQTSEKAESARIFKAVYDRARVDHKYLILKEAHKALLRTEAEKCNQLLPAPSS
jgi:hypothetical protein